MGMRVSPAREKQSLFTAAPLPVAKLGAEEALACLRLIRSENVGPATFRQLINHFGGARQALDALPDLARRGGARRMVAICQERDAIAELEAAERIGAQPVFTIEPGYPARLAALDMPPPLVYVIGDLAMLNRPAIAIVGSRSCSAAGIKLTQHFAASLSEAGYVVVSGLARGIDRVAHEASIGRGTVAVLAGGLDVIYPPEHADLQARIGQQGCLISERPPGLKPREKDFPRRNRIISGLALGVVIVEAAARSGTLVTARYANEQGREVFAVPGHPLDPRAEGTNRLIQRGATMALTPQDVLEVLRPMVGMAEERAMALAPAEPDCEGTGGSFAAGTAASGEDALSLVASALGPAPIDIDALVRATGLGTRAVQIALMELDLAGRLDRPGHGLVALRER